MNSCEFALFGTVPVDALPAFKLRLQTLCGVARPFSCWERHFAHHVDRGGDRKQLTQLCASNFEPDAPHPAWRVDCLGELAHPDRSRCRIRNVYSSFVGGDVTRFLQNLGCSFQYECLKVGFFHVQDGIVCKVYQLYRLPAHGDLGRKERVAPDWAVECSLTAGAEADLQTEQRLLDFAQPLQPHCHFVKEPPS